MERDSDVLGVADAVVIGMSNVRQAERHRLKLRATRLSKKRTRQIVKLAIAGTIDARQFTERRWRIWLPRNPNRSVDYWPRNGKACLRGFNVDVQEVLSILQETRHD